MNEKIKCLIVDIDSKDNYIEGETEGLVFNINEISLRKFDAYDGKILNYIFYYKITEFLSVWKLKNNISKPVSILDYIYPVKNVIKDSFVPSWIFKGLALKKVKLNYLVLVLV